MLYLQENRAYLHALFEISNFRTMGCDYLSGKLFRSNKGSMTIEAAIVFQVVFLTVIALLFFGLMLYQQSCIQTIAERSVQRGAEVWNCPGKDMIMAQITKDRMKDVSLYWRIFGMDSARSAKESKIESYAEYYSWNSSVLGRPINIETHVQMTEDYVVYKKIRVTVDAYYKNPAGSLLRAFGFDDRIQLSAHADAVINEPVEFIRSTDFASDVVKEIDNKVFKGKGQEAVTKVKDAFSNIFSKLKTFTDTENK
jgi:hypothetical protein